jgi:NAD(P)-dependent dehydrogenase (short-subunit alcohol dehydrogenase family)
MNSLSGKSVIVTGGGSGIGASAAMLLAEAGCLVTVADLNETGGKSVVEEIVRTGKGKAQFLRTNVADEADVKALVAAAEGSYGRLDGAINSAGVAQRGVPLASLSLEDWDRVHRINLRGMFLCMKHQILSMQRTGGGSIVAISAGASINGVPNSSEYCAAKSGVNGLVRAGAVDYADKGIRVNAVLPGGTATPMLQGALLADPMLDKIIATFPMKRLARPEEIASAAVWLISDSASYVTGATWSVDGALSIA